VKFQPGPAKTHLLILPKLQLGVNVADQTRRTVLTVFESWRDSVMSNGKPLKRFIGNCGVPSPQASAGGEYGQSASANRFNGFRKLVRFSHVERKTVETVHR
jgi:hypothetical protein